MSERVTLKMIAREAGVHYSTVSLALNEHPSIPVATRKRIQAVATELGYRPDPILGALVAYRTQQKESREHGVLAWFDSWPAEVGPRQRFPALWHGAVARASALGWKLEEFRLARQMLPVAKLSRMLRARGIEGVLIPPFPEGSAKIELSWDWFSCVTIGHTLVAPRLHRVAPHHVHNMQVLLRELHDRGYHRPGLAIDEQVNERTLHQWTAAFLDAQLISAARNRVPPLIYAPGGDADVLAWRARYLPDVIVTNRVLDLVPLLESAGIRIPQDLGVAGPAYPTEMWSSERDAPAAGVDERHEVIGSAAVDLLVGMIHRHERGLPSDAIHSLVEGCWNDGPTVRARNTTG